MSDCMQLAAHPSPCAVFDKYPGANQMGTQRTLTARCKPKGGFNMLFTVRLHACSPPRPPFSPTFPPLPTPWPPVDCSCVQHRRAAKNAPHG